MIGADQLLFINPRESNLYNISKIQLHLDAKNFYLGAGSIYHDNQASHRPYSGIQIPIDLKLNTKYIPIYKPFYAQFSYQYKLFKSLKEEIITEIDPSNSKVLQMNDGSWQRAKNKFITPRSD